MNKHSPKKTEDETDRSNMPDLWQKIQPHIDELKNNEPDSAQHLQTKIKKLTLKSLIALSDINIELDQGDCSSPLDVATQLKNKIITTESHTKNVNSAQDSDQLTLGKLAAEIKKLSARDLTKRIILYGLAKHNAEQIIAKILTEIESYDIISAMHFLSIIAPSLHASFLPQMFIHSDILLPHIKSETKNILANTTAKKTLEALERKPIYTQNYFTKEEIQILKLFDTETLLSTNPTKNPTSNKNKINIILILLNRDTVNKERGTLSILESRINNFQKITKLITKKNRSNPKKVQEILYKYDIDTSQTWHQKISDITFNEKYKEITKSLKQISKTKSQQNWRKNKEKTHRIITVYTFKPTIEKLSYLINKSHKVTNNTLPLNQILSNTLASFFELPEDMRAVIISHYREPAESINKDTSSKVELTFLKSDAKNFESYCKQKKLTYSLLARIAVLWKAKNFYPSPLDCDSELISKIELQTNKQDPFHSPFGTEVDNGKSSK